MFLFIDISVSTKNENKTIKTNTVKILKTNIINNKNDKYIFIIFNYFAYKFF